MKKLLTVVIVALMAVSCCAPCRSRAKNAKALEGTMWHLVKVGARV